jgi:hypothetical protein
VTAKHYIVRPAVGPDHREILERFGGVIAQAYAA